MIHQNALQTPAHILIILPTSFSRSLRNPWLSILRALKNARQSIGPLAKRMVELCNCCQSFRNKLIISTTHVGGMSNGKFQDQIYALNS
jgi:hypothetical protein